MAVKGSAAAPVDTALAADEPPTGLNRGLHGASLPSWRRHRGMGAYPMGARMSPLIGDDPRGGMPAIDSLGGEEQGWQLLLLASSIAPLRNRKRCV